MEIKEWTPEKYGEYAGELKSPLPEIMESQEGLLDKIRGVFRKLKGR